jgi:hypothetical protein
MSLTRLDFAQILCQNYFCPGESRPEIEQFLVAVMAGEDSGAWYNPLDTTLALSTYDINYNGAGVKNYINIFDGFKATKETFELSFYTDLVAIIKDVKSTAIDMANAFSRTPWGYVGDKLPLEIVSDFNRGTLSYVESRRQLIGRPPVGWIGTDSKLEFLSELEGLI